MKTLAIGIVVCLLGVAVSAQTKKPVAKLSAIAQCRVDEQAAVDALVARIAERDTLRV